MSFDGLITKGYGAILADPPWRFEVWSGETAVKARDSEPIHYESMSANDLAALPVASLAAEDCVLFLWVTWPTLIQALKLIETWGFTYKTCGFDWMKAKGIQRNYSQTDKRFSLFNTHRWTEARPTCCDVVPVLYSGLFTPSCIYNALTGLKTNGSMAAPGLMNPEGVIIWHAAARTYFKVTLERDEEYKGKAA